MWELDFHNNILIILSVVVFLCMRFYLGAKTVKQRQTSDNTIECMNKTKVAGPSSEAWWHRPTPRCFSFRKLHFLVLREVKRAAKHLGVS